MLKQSKSDAAKGGSPQATSDLKRAPDAPNSGEETMSGALAMPKVGHRVLGHLRLQQILERQNQWSLFVAEDEVRSELVLVAVAESQAAMARALEGPSAANVVTRGRFGSLYVAEILLDESHVQRFGGRLLPPDSEAPPRVSAMPVAAEGSFAEGSLFANRYRVDGLIGRGAMGEVYRAYDQTLLRPVAVKVVRVNADYRGEAKRRLVNEARVVSQVQHPHIVEIYDAGESEGFPYLVLELCDGGNLRKVMGEDPSQADRLRWLTEIAEALAHAHDQGVIHRDIKPENVLLTGAHGAKVADFGIAKALRKRGADKEPVGLVGTPRYMAPEQLFDNNADTRADQFAWGLVAYELLTGMHPRSNDAVTLRAARSGARTSRVPWHVRRVLARATNNDPAARYPNFHLLLADLHPSRRRRLFPVFAGAAAGVAVVGAILGNSLVAHRAKATSAETNAKGETPATFDAEKIDADIVSRCAPNARPSLAAGLQLWRDASQWESLPKFEEAANVDPACAPASVYYLLVASHNFPKRRELFRRAREQRATLNERESMLLDAIEPTVVEPPDFEKAQRLAAAMIERMPADLDARWLYVRALRRLNRVDEALAAAERTAALSPVPIPGNELEAALMHTSKREMTATYENFARCLRASPDSAGCLLWEGELLATQGECVRAEGTFRHLMEVVPQSEQGQLDLAVVLLMSSNNAAAARGAFEERWRLYTPGFNNHPTREAARLSDEYRMALVGGDLEKALAFARKWSEEVSTSTNGKFRGDALTELIGLLQELGQVEEARALAGKGLREQRAWTTDERLDVPIELARLAYLTGAVDATEFRRQRDEWRRSATRPREEEWVAGFAGLPVVGADMPPPFGPGEYVQDWLNMTPETFARASTELLRMGRVTDALLHADAAAKNCFPYSEMGYLHAQMAGAAAHDAAHDTAGACKRYTALKGLLAKSPRSITFQTAIKRIKVLSCEDEIRH